MFTASRRLEVSSNVLVLWNFIIPYLIGLTFHGPTLVHTWVSSARRRAQSKPHFLLPHMGDSNLSKILSPKLIKPNFLAAELNVFQKLTSFFLHLPFIK